MNQAEVKRKQIQFYSYAVCLVLLIYFGHLLGSNGLAYFMVGFVTVGFFLQFLSSASSDAIGKMLRYRRKRGMFLNAYIVRKRMLIVLSVISIVSFLIVFLLAEVLADKLFGVPNAGLIIRILSPVILIRMLVGYWQGFFQSFGSQLQTTFAGILRPLFYFVFGKALCNSNLEYGYKVAALLKNDDFGGMYGAMGLAGAVVITEMIIFVVMLVFYFISDRKSDKSKSKDGLQGLEGWRETLGAYGRLGTPGICIGLIGYLMVAAAMALLNDKEQIGIFFGMFMVVAALVILLTGARYYLIFAKTVHALKGDHNRHIRDMIQTGLKYAWCYGIMGCMLMAVLATQISYTFFDGNTAVVGLLQKGSLLIPVIMVLAYWILVHVAHHRYLGVFIALLANVGTFILLAVFMKGRMEDVTGAVVMAGIVSLGINCVAFGAVTINMYRLQIEYIITFILPLACVGMVGLVLMAGTKILTPHIGNEVCFYLCAALGYVLYLVLLGICRIFMEQDINQIYGKFGRKILSYIFK